ncbi:hypothetical protein B0H21DRAFT_752815 [Amylocystis lapponica]|nr:hypothetical protein B0H21DRAFT_772390 [Amylocystis lapponica]KAH9941446.1 hypothetical protein B0H21DRAFT_752815 [Amylocystis lapponica]
MCAFFCPVFYGARCYSPRERIARLSVASQYSHNPPSSATLSCYHQDWRVRCKGMMATLMGHSTESVKTHISFPDSQYTRALDTHIGLRIVSSQKSCVFTMFYLALYFAALFLSAPHFPAARIGHPQREKLDGVAHLGEYALVCSVLNDVLFPWWNNTRIQSRVSRRCCWSKRMESG